MDPLSTPASPPVPGSPRVAAITGGAVPSLASHRDSGVASRIHDMGLKGSTLLSSADSLRQNSARSHMGVNSPPARSLTAGAVSTGNSKQQLLTRLRHIQSEAESALFQLYDIKSNLAVQVNTCESPGGGGGNSTRLAGSTGIVATFGQPHLVHPTEAGGEDDKSIARPLTVEQAQANMQAASHLVRQSIRHAQAAEQELLQLCHAPSDFAQCKRFQDMTTSLRSRHSAVTHAIDVSIFRLRKQQLLQKRHEEARQTAAESGAGDAARELHQERQALDTTMTIVVDSIASAKESFASLQTQGYRLRYVGRQAGNMVKQIVRSDVLIEKIKRLKLKQQLVVVVVFMICLSLTLIAIANKMS